MRCRTLSALGYISTRTWCVCVCVWRRSSRRDINTASSRERRTIERDVEGWDNLFLAGRMQKPYERVMGVREEEEDDDDNDDDNGLA